MWGARVEGKVVPNVVKWTVYIHNTFACAFGLIATLDSRR